MIQLINALNKMFTILSGSDKLVSKNTDLIDFSETEIFTPVGNIATLLNKHVSKLPDHPINFNLLKLFVNKLNVGQSIIRLNHIGFCYKVNSQENEKKRLVGLIKSSNYHLYEEKSNDYGLWLFIGDTNKWEKQMIELLPVVKTDDKWIEYWLPHIHIDIDTNLSSKEIEDLIRIVYGNRIKPFPIIIDGIIYIERFRLGSIGGINLFLDLATKVRNVKYSRQNLLTRID
jgi:hypothetical protein